MDTDYTVVYFHGYGSSPQSDKVKGLSQHFDVFAPEIPIQYDVAKAYLHGMLSDYCRKRDLVLVGTSLGGYWAGVMSNLLALPAVLINPSCYPSVTLSRYRDSKLTEEELRKYIPLVLSTDAPRSILLAKDDNVINYEVAETLFSKKCDVKVFETGGHRFNCINTIRDSIIELQKGFGTP
jgi:predicted esterase YcpF (UPF0227 family)